MLKFSIAVIGQHSRCSLCKLNCKVIIELEATLNDPATELEHHTDLHGVMDRWNAAGAKVLSRDKRKSSPRWFELSAEVLLPAIEEKK